MVIIYFGCYGLSATLGNVLGSCVNYWLGTQVMRFKDRKWFPVSEKSIEKLKNNSINTVFTVYCLLGCLLSAIPLTVVGGIFRVKFSIFLLLVTLGKGARYLAVLAFAVGLEKLF